MVRLKNPLLSFDAHGTVGDSVTFQSSTRRKFARQKPRLPYSLTLPQQYQRWLYEDYAHLWLAQSAATRQEYREAGSRFHLTGYQYWMKYNLAKLPDIDAWYKLDSISGGLALDSSHNGLDLAVVGAGVVDGVIGHQFYFDGINDRLWRARDAHFDFTDEMTLECFYTPDAFDRWNRIVSFDTPVNPRYLLYHGLDNKFTLFINDGAGVGLTMTTPLAYTTKVPHHLAFRIKAGSQGLFVDGVWLVPGAFTFSNFSPAGPFQVGCYATPPFEWAKGYVDHLIKYNRYLDDTEILRHSKRRYQS